MKDLLKLKGEIIAKHLPKIIEQQTKANENLMQLMTKAISDKKISANVGFDILNKINAQGQLGTQSSTNMTGEQRLELAKLWFANAQIQMSNIDSSVKSTYESYIKNIDDQLVVLQKEIDSIDKEIDKETNPKEKEKLRERKDDIYKSAA